MVPPLCSGGPPSCIRFTLPTARERWFSLPEIGEKERVYLFKELYKLKGNDLMSSLKTLKSFRIPTDAHSPSFPLRPVWVPHLRKRSRDPWFFSAQATWSQKAPARLLCLGLNHSTNLPLQPPFPTPPTISYTCQHPHILPALLGCHSKSGQVWSQGAATRGSCFPVPPWVEVTPISLAQSRAIAI